MPTNTMTSSDRISLINSGITRGNGYPWSSLSTAITLTETLGLEWPAAVTKAFDDARAAQQTVRDAVRADQTVTWGMLAAPDATDQIRGVIASRTINSGASSIRAEANQAISHHIVGALTAAAPKMLEKLAKYATDHAEDRRFNGVTGDLPADLAAKVHTWAHIENLHVALLNVAEGEAIGSDLPAGSFASRFYDWTPEQWEEFTDLHPKPEEQRTSLHDYALNRDMPVNLATSYQQLHARGAANEAITSRIAKAQQEAREQAALARPRTAAHVRPSGNAVPSTSAATIGSMVGAID